MPIPGYSGPTAFEAFMEQVINFCKGLIDAASATGPTAGGHAADMSAGLNQETGIVDCGPLCYHYDPELQSILTGEF